MPARQACSGYASVQAGAEIGGRRGGMDQKSLQLLVNAMPTGSWDELEDIP